MARHFQDDDYDDRPQYDESSSGKAVLMVVLGVLALIALGGTAAVGLFFMRADVVRQERDAAVQAQAIAQANLVAVQAETAAPPQAPDAFPMPNAPASENFPTDLGPEREPEHQGNWTILFRSDDPGYWDTPGNAANYAIPLFRAPVGIRFLRLKRMDTGDALIVPVTAVRMRSPPKVDSGPPGGPPVIPPTFAFWMGMNVVENGALHLGVIDPGEPVVRRGVAIDTDESGGSGGSGFGHKRDTEGAGQRYAWKGQEIAKAVFEIAVTAAELADDEKPLLVNRDPNP
jgi:hypothetical protein